MSDPTKLATFRMRPAQIEAMQVLGGEDDNVPAVLSWILSARGRAVDCIERGTLEHGVVVETPTGNRKALPEQWVIHHGGGQFDVLGWSAFDGLYEVGAVPGTPAATTQDQALVKLADRLDYEAAICGHRDKGRHMLRIEQIAKELRQLAALSPAPGNEPDGAAEREVVADFCAERERYITSINNCAPDNYHDYYRWQGHAEARRQLAQRLERAASVAQEGGDRG